MILKVSEPSLENGSVQDSWDPRFILNETESKTTKSFKMVMIIGYSYNLVYKSIISKVHRLPFFNPI